MSFIDYIISFCRGDDNPGLLKLRDALLTYAFFHPGKIYWVELSQKICFYNPLIPGFYLKVTHT